MIVGLALAFTCLIQPFSLCASVDTDSLMYEIHFPINSATVDTSFQQNDVTYRALQRLAGDTLAEIRKIDIRSWASPDGRRAFNLRLSENRAAATRRFILQTFPQAAGKTSSFHQGEAWDLFRQHTALDSTLDAESNSQLRQILESDSPALTKKRAFRSLPFFGTLAENLLPQLRKSLILIWVDRENASITPPYGLTDTISLPVPPCQADAGLRFYTSKTPVSASTSRGICVGVKTNILYDALLVPNVGVEIPLGRHWSVSADWMYAWWRSDRKHNYWRIYGGDAEVRYWFSPDEGKPLSRHHVGVYAQMLTYDFELGHRGYLADKWSYAAGASYGYSLPFTHRLHLDFAVCIGYMGGTFKEYIPDDGCYVWQSTKRRRYIGPTKAEVSLVWILRRGYTSRKGGSR